MWMMGYSDGGDLYMSDSFNASRKLRPLIPRPVTAATSNAGAAISAPRLHGADHHMFSLNHNMASMADQNKRDFNAQQVVVSSRWNPTPEQLRALEELYRRGTRTPSAEQIQHITAQLRRYGKIEGKNVFYWFQNHKARERQKRRRQMESDDQSNRDVEIPERKETGASRTVFGVDQQTKNWPPSSNSSTLPEESAACTQKAAKAAGRAECKSSDHHQWMKMDERVEAVGIGIGRELELQSRRNDTWQAMQLSYPSLSPPTHLINTLKPPMDPKFINKKPSNNPHLTTFLLSPPPLSYNRSHDEDDEEEEEIEEDQDHQHHNHHIINLHLMNGARREVDDDNSQTLQLFPLRSGDFGYENANGKETEMSMAAINNGFTTTHQFFEFLPLKN